MSKAALDQFTKCLAMELAPKGVRVNSVNPGVIYSEIQRRSGITEDTYQAYLKRSEFTHPLGRVGNPEETAKAIAFLATEDSSFTTGELLKVDGGRAVMTVC
uniref:SDR family oxidoreductase n=2 Tax=Bursaphelenchus xylophilus TaxID=6326 RepID=A0A1I7S526_BURXY